MNVWTPYGFRARRNLDAVMIREIEATGSQAVEFPTLIPATEFAKEKEHIKGFDAEVYWVTRAGASELDVPLVLRPTSETAMYPVFALWVRSHQDLPLNVYQIVNTFRYETKTTRPVPPRARDPLLRGAHLPGRRGGRDRPGRARTSRAFERMAAAFALPFLAIRRPDWDKFAGAYYSIALDIPVGEARTLQIGSVHHYRENFARPYGIQYEAADGTTHYAHQTTFGLSERLLGAILAVHGDAKGAVFPTRDRPLRGRRRPDRLRKIRRPAQPGRRRDRGAAHPARGSGPTSTTRATGPERSTTGGSSSARRSGSRSAGARLRRAR